MPPRKPSQLSFHLAGSRVDGGLVRAGDFVDWLEHVLTCLRKLEKGRRGGAETVYRISSLAIGSAVVTIEAGSEADRNLTAKGVVQDFMIGAEAVRKGSIEKLPFDKETKAAFASLAAPLRRQLRKVTISSGRKKVDLAIQQAISLLPEKSVVESISVSSYTGYIDALNVHSAPLLFYLYPTVGPSRIPCEFDKPHLEAVRTAIKRYTTVTGACEFAPGSPFPDRIVVDQIAVNPPEETLPSFRSLYGTAQRLPDGLDSVAYIRQQRDAES